MVNFEKLITALQLKLIDYKMGTMTRETILNYLKEQISLLEKELINE